MIFNEQSTLEDLIAGCVRQERLAQKYLYQKFYSPMFAIAMRYSTDEDQAAHILNAGFLKVFTKIDSYSQSGSFPAWVKRIIVNTALDEIRRNNKHKSNLQIEEVQEPALTDSIIDKLKAEDLLKTIQQLPEMTRIVFNMYAVEGYKHQEIAEKLSIPVGTSKWHVSTGRKLLKEKLAHYLTETQR